MTTYRGVFVDDGAEDEFRERMFSDKQPEPRQDARCPDGHPGYAENYCAACARGEEPRQDAGGEGRSMGAPWGDEPIEAIAAKCVPPAVRAVIEAETVAAIVAWMRSEAHKDGTGVNAGYTELQLAARIEAGEWKK